MYGMIMLFVDSKEEPFTGWVKTETNGSISTLGFISKDKSRVCGWHGTPMDKTVGDRMGK